MHICVYGAASEAIDKRYLESAEELGRRIALAGHTLVYGAGATGVMGACARGCYEAGGKIVGIVPSFFEEPSFRKPSSDTEKTGVEKTGILFPHCTEMIFTETMRERKQLLEDRSDVYIVAPGGIGTMDEFFEILTLHTLGQHNKPVILWNLHGCWNDLIRLLDNFVANGFMSKENRDMVQVMENLW